MLNAFHAVVVLYFHGSKNCVNPVSSDPLRWLAAKDSNWGTEKDKGSGDMEVGACDNFQTKSTGDSRRASAADHTELLQQQLPGACCK